MKLIPLVLFITANTTVTMGQEKKAVTSNVEQKVNNLLKEMTLEEKIGQLNQYTGEWEVTGPVTNSGNLLEDVKTG